MTHALHHGKLEDVLPTLPPDSVDACVTDTPYHLTANKKGGSGAASVNLNSPAGRARIGAGTGFMGMGWDGGDVAFRVETWRAVFRVLKPGAYLLAFGGTRTHHRMVCAIEDAGFEIRDEIDWIFGSGFPKSLNLEGEWDGWGTALKPAKEPICVARKPLIGTVEQNVAAHRTGALNIDGCRVVGAKGDGNWSGRDIGGNPGGLYEGGFKPRLERDENTLGRWPANVVHDGSPEVVAAFPEAGGQQGDLDGQSSTRISRGIFGDMPAPRVALARIESETSAARFFYCAKASQVDREHGLDNHEIIYVQCSAWENADQKARLRVDTGRSPPRVIDVSGAPTNSVSEWNTLLFGSPSMGKSLLDLKSIIETETNLEISSPTLDWFRMSLTNASIAGANGSRASAGSLVENADTSLRLMSITSDALASALGVVRVASKTRWTISAKDERRCTHPTVKPTALMRWLCRLITPPGGTVLDPFTGSGSTGRGAILEGFNFIGIEMTDEYIPIARARIAAAEREAARETEEKRHAAQQTELPL